MEDNKLNILITISTFFSAITLSLGSSYDECLTTECDILSACLTITIYSWLLALMVVSYIILNNNKNVTTHRISLISFIFANIMTLVYISFVAIYRIYDNKIIRGVISLVCLLILIIIMIIIRYINR